MDVLFSFKSQATNPVIKLSLRPFILQCHERYIKEPPHSAFTCLCYLQARVSCAYNSRQCMVDEINLVNN
jgi:hypothetical protein